MFRAIGVGVVTMMIVGTNTQTAPAFATLHSIHRASTMATTCHGASGALHASNGLSTNQEEDATGSPDLYGNEVTDAVTKYKLDVDGGLYEVHSPETELPRLASPLG